MKQNSKTRALNNRLNQELADNIDDELELEFDDERLANLEELAAYRTDRDTIDRKLYFKGLLRLQGELVKLQDWVVDQRLKVVVIFEVTSPRSVVRVEC